MFVGALPRMSDPQRKLVRVDVKGGFEVGYCWDSRAMENAMRCDLSQAFVYFVLPAGKNMRVYQWDIVGIAVQWRMPLRV